MLVLAGCGIALLRVAGDEAGRATLRVLGRGLGVTVRVTLLSFVMALVIGLLLGLGRVSRRRLLRELTSLYVEVVRGFPMLVLILWIGYALVPWVFQSLMAGVAWLDGRGLALGGLVPGLLATCRRPSDCISPELRGIVGLGLGYGAYVAEIVRAGIQSVQGGQMEAALSLGMSRRQGLRHVVLPQALRLSLPPLGNDFIALLKDSALVSVLTVPDVVYEARVHVAKTFQALEVWNVVALVYLALTLTLSLGVRRLERRSSWPGGDHAAG
ncbi:MAG: amino acid ABC transporter permease [Caldilineae bacterium]|nr:amino acid ABC transporter permease [Chloroflexota bacterium]MCB9176447.1 amino acid ABC transporter permease [Caldilineae bacterium]